MIAMGAPLDAGFAAWSWRTEVLLVLVLLAGAYTLGWWRLRCRLGRADLARPGRFLLYLGATGMLGLALLSPIDRLGSLLFTMHMLQHELLAMGAAPLLLLANSLPILLWALPKPLRHAMGRCLVRDAPVRRALQTITWMPVAWPLFMVIYWGWHVPPAYEAALAHELLHDLEHLSFFGTAVVFWWPIVNPAPRMHGHIPYTFRIVYVLAALLLPMLPAMTIAFFARRVFYPHYAAVPRLWGLTALEDQAAGWILMGAWEGLVFLIALLALLARAFDREERMTRERESLGLAPERDLA